MLPPSSARTENSRRSSSVDYARKSPQSKTRKSSASLLMWSHTLQPFTSSLPNVWMSNNNDHKNNSNNTNSDTIRGNKSVSLSSAAPACSSVPTLSLGSPHMSSPITSSARDGERVLVAVRCRPPNPLEGERAEDVIVSMDMGRKQVYVQPQGISSSSDNYSNITDATNSLCYSVDVPLWSGLGQSKDGLASCSQSHVYDIIGRPLLLHALDGFNSTLIAYGQTGSGKTYTMMGNWQNCRSNSCRKADTDANRLDMNTRDRRDEAAGQDGALSSHCGLTPRICHDLFDEICARTNATAASGTKHDWQVHIRYVEVYNERICDLLNHNAPATVREEVTVQQANFVLVGARRVRVHAAEELVQQLARGNRCRRTAETCANEHSSRSHAIFYIELTEVVSSVAGGALPSCDINGQANVTSKSMTIRLVDLAGSERMTEIINTAQHVQEIKDINRSLFTLGRVIECLSDTAQRRAKKQPPYRDSILTKLLRDALGGNSKTTMICTISPCASSRVQTLQTLHYSTKARCVRNKPRIRIAKRAVSVHSLYTTTNSNLAAATGLTAPCDDQLYRPFSKDAYGQICKEQQEQQEQQQKAYAAQMTAAEVRLQQLQNNWQETESAMQSRAAALCETQTHAETCITALERRSAALLGRLRDCANASETSEACNSVHVHTEGGRNRRRDLPIRRSSTKQEPKRKTTHFSFLLLTLFGNDKTFSQRLNEVRAQSRRHCRLLYRCMSPDITRNRQTDHAPARVINTASEVNAEINNDTTTNSSGSKNSSAESPCLSPFCSPSSCQSTRLHNTHASTDTSWLVQCAHDCLDVHHLLTAELVCRNVMEHDEQAQRHRLQQRCVRRLRDVLLIRSNDDTICIRHESNSNKTNDDNKVTNVDSHSTVYSSSNINDIRHSDRIHYHDCSCRFVMDVLEQLEERERAVLTHARARDLLFMAWTMRVCGGEASTTHMSSPVCALLTSLCDVSLSVIEDSMMSRPAHTSSPAQPDKLNDIRLGSGMDSNNNSHSNDDAKDYSDDLEHDKDAHLGAHERDVSTRQVNSAALDHAVPARELHERWRELHMREAAVRAHETALQRRVSECESQLQRRRAAFAQNEHHLRCYLYELERVDAATMCEYAARERRAASAQARLHAKEAALQTAMRDAVILTLVRSAEQCMQLCAAEETIEREGIERICHTMLELDRARQDEDDDDEARCEGQDVVHVHNVRECEQADTADAEQSHRQNSAHAQHAQQHHLAHSIHTAHKEHAPKDAHDAQSTSCMYTMHTQSPHPRRGPPARHSFGPESCDSKQSHSSLPLPELPHTMSALRRSSSHHTHDRARHRGGGRCVRLGHPHRRSEHLRRLKQQLRMEKARLLEHICRAEANERDRRNCMHAEDATLWACMRTLRDNPETRAGCDGTEPLNPDEAVAERSASQIARQQQQQQQRCSNVCAINMTTTATAKHMTGNVPSAVTSSISSSPALSLLSSTSSFPRRDSLARATSVPHDNRSHKDNTHSATHLSKIYVYDTSKLLAQREQQLVRERDMRRELNHTAATLVTDLLNEMEALRRRAAAWRRKFHTMRAEFKVECEVCHWRNEATRDMCLCCGNTRLLCGEASEEEEENYEAVNRKCLEEAKPLLLRSSVEPHVAPDNRVDHSGKNSNGTTPRTGNAIVANA